MNIVTVTDDNYWKGTAALFQSVEQNSQLSEVSLTAVYDNLAKANQEKLLAVFPRLKLISTKELLAEYNLPIEKVHRSKQERLKKLSIFGLSCQSKMLYIDSDVLCLKSLRPLEKFEHFSACLNIGKDFPKSIKNRPMFNSGVMIFRPTRYLFDSILKFSDKYEFDKNYADQALLNNFFYSDNPKTFVSLMSQEFNLPITNKRYNPRLWKYFQASGVALLHYTAVKPWLLNRRQYSFKIDKKLATSKFDAFFWYNSEVKLWNLYFDKFESRLFSS